MNKFTTSLSLAALVATGALTTTVSADEDIALEEIIVTAQKREQNLKDVPISVVALKGETLRDFMAAGEDIRALSGRVPGLNIESSNGRVAPRFYLRGLGNTDFDLAASQPVSVIMDDVVMENVALKSFPLFDVERVEVIRGPQGTLFGKNTPAGIVKIDTAGPNADETSGYVSANFGSNTLIGLEAAFGGPITDKISYRVATMLTSQKDWIDNGYTGQSNAMGGFKDQAARVKVLFDMSENFSALLNVHARSLDGTSSIFRANILTTGSNKLNDNYDRDTVWYDEGDNNPQAYDGMGGSLKLNWSTDAFSITSITAYERADGSSLGDIDGGYGAVYMPEMGPGFIPFNSATMDEMDKTEQFTQEIRVASMDDSDLQWQAGLYYFESDLSVTTSPFFIPSSNVKHDNESFAAFGQASYDISDATTLTVGARYTIDEKSLLGTFAFGDIFTESVNDERLSWDVAVNHAVSDDITVFSRVASGFRAPSIQGRDIAFFGAPSVAKSETIMSYEVGAKGSFMDGRGRFSSALYLWDMKDQQMSAIGGGGNFIQLINAPKTQGYGFELDLELMPVDNFLLTASYAYNHTELKDTLYVAACGSGQCTPLDPRANLGTSADPAWFHNAIGNPLPQSPNWVASVTARYDIDMGDGTMFISTDWFLEGKRNIFIYDAVEFKTSGDFEGGIKVGYEWNGGAYQVALFGRNITNEHNIKGAIDFNNNTAYVNAPRVWGVSFRGNF